MPISYSTQLNREQLQVVTEGGGPCLVLAGAGTGKTRTLVYRVAYLLEQGVDPEKILLVTFTNKAAREMLSRIEGLLGPRAASVWGGTFHHVGHLVLRRYGSRIGIAPGFTILDQDDNRELIKGIMDEMKLLPERKGKKETVRSDKKEFPSPDVIENLISFAISSTKELPALIEEWLPKQAEHTEEIIQLAKAYEQKKRERNLLSFDDLLFLWLRILRERPEVHKSLGGRFEYILIDEYQDTNRLQGMIVEELAREHKNVLVVGDDAQSIYAFRAATVENIMRFPEIFPGAKLFKLEQNYRSTQHILDLANASITCNRRQFEKNLRTIHGVGKKPELIGCADSFDEARFIANTVETFCDEHQSLKESAVLFRAAFQGMQLELELQKRGVPYVIRGGIRFFEQAHIKDVIAYLKIVANPGDEIAWQRILKLEEGIGVKGAAAISKHVIVNAVKQSHGDGVEIAASPTVPRDDMTPRIREKVSKIHVRLDHIKKIVEMDKMIKYLLDAFYEEYAERTFENARDRLEDLEQMAIFSRTYETLEAFLADATLSDGFKGEHTRKKHAADEYLVLSTIHQAKGLEWRNVFVLGLVDGQFPHNKSRANRDDLEEERRLFYVAVTRAKERLFLTYPIMSTSFSGGGMNQPSLFIRELSPNLYKTMVENEEEVVEIRD